MCQKSNLDLKELEYMAGELTMAFDGEATAWAVPITKQLSAVKIEEIE